MQFHVAGNSHLHNHICKLPGLVVIEATVVWLDSSAQNPNVVVMLFVCSLNPL